LIETYLKLFTGLPPFASKFLESLIDDSWLSKLVKLVFKLNNNRECSLEEALKAITTSDVMLEKFKLEVEKLEKLKQIAELKDRQDARKRDQHIVSHSGKNSRANLMLSMCFFGLCFFVIILLFAKNLISAEIKAVLTAIIGILGACLREAFLFEFGGSISKNLEQNEIRDIVEE
jgi:hypothetical protein